MFAEISPPSNAKHYVHQAFGKGIEVEDTIATLNTLTTISSNCKGKWFFPTKSGGNDITDNAWFEKLYQGLSLNCH